MLDITLKLTDIECREVFDDIAHKFRTEVYTNFFPKKLNALGITCVLAAEMKKSNTSHTLQFYCLHKECKRMYRLKAKHILDPFSIEYAGDLNHQQRGVTCPLNYKARDDAREELASPNH